MELDTASLEASGYDAVLVDEGGSEIARVAFWLRDPRAIDPHTAMPSAHARRSAGTLSAAT